MTPCLLCLYWFIHTHWLPKHVNNVLSQDNHKWKICDLPNNNSNNSKKRNKNGKTYQMRNNKAKQGTVINLFSYRLSLSHLIFFYISCAVRVCFILLLFLKLR